MDVVKNSIRNQMMNFALDVVELYRKLVFDQKEFVISKRLLKSGTSLGVRYSAGEGEKAYKKAVETEFWLELLKEMFSKESDEGTCVTARNFFGGSVKGKVLLPEINVMCEKIRSLIKNLEKVI